MDKKSKEVQYLDANLMTSGSRDRDVQERLVVRKTKSFAKGFGIKFGRTTKEVVAVPCEKKGS